MNEWSPCRQAAWTPRPALMGTGLLRHLMTDGGWEPQQGLQVLWEHGWDSHAALGQPGRLQSRGGSSTTVHREAQVHGQRQMLGSESAK